MNLGSIACLSGPHHLASLLIVAENALRPYALSGIQCPKGIDTKGWRNFISKYAQYKPFIWPNHKEAIEGGYLDIGKSSAVSFPTGAGS